MAQVPATSYESTSLGDVAEFTIPFPFLSRAEVFVTVDGASVPFTWINDGLVQLAAVPELGAIVRRYRSTAAYVPLHQFSTGVPFLPRYVDRDFKQTLYAVQESVNDTANTSALALQTAEQALTAVQDSFDILSERTQYMVLGPYGPGLNFQTTSQVFSYLGEFYAPGPAITLPYTTTGVGAAEIANFRSVGDAILRSDLDNGADPAKGAALVGYKGRTVYQKLNEVVSVKDFGAVGDGFTNDEAAKNATEAANTWVYWPAGNYVLTTPPTLGKSFGPGKIFIAGVQQYLHPVDGPVDGIHVSVFEPATDGNTDVSTKLQAAIDYAQDRDLHVILQKFAMYRVSTGLTMKHGRSATDAKSYHALMRGNFATIFPGPGITGLRVFPRCALADAATGRGVATINLTQLRFNGFFTDSASRAFIIGAGNFHCDGFGYNVLDNILVHGAFTNVACIFTECRHIAINELVIRSGTMQITANNTGSFCGDMVFKQFEGQGTEAVPPMLISAGAGTTNAQIRGIKFDHAVFYGTGTRMSPNGPGAKIGDIWFESPQFDGPAAPAGERALIMDPGNGSSMFKIFIDSPYFVNYTGPAIHAVRNGTAAFGLKIRGGGISQVTGTAAPLRNAAVICFGLNHLHIADVEFDSIGAGAANSSVILVDTCENVIVANNKSTNSSAVNYGISIGSGNKQSVIGNMMNVATAVVNEFTVPAIRQAANNLLT